MNIVDTVGIIKKILKKQKIEIDRKKIGVKN